MPDQSRDVRPSPFPRKVFFDKKMVTIPDDWELLPPGDAGLTRRVKAAGPCWTSSEKKGRKVFSRGVWACSKQIEAARSKLEEDRKDPAYQKKLDAGRARRAKVQVAYAEAFETAVFDFLKFDAEYDAMARKMAKAIAEHAVPVGSGTVARTKQIPVEKRAEAATIAWMRHQTTGYDNLSIPRVKGKRREVRQMLAKHSRRLLNRYRGRGPSVEDVDEACPLQAALFSREEL